MTDERACRQCQKPMPAGASRHSELCSSECRRLSAEAKAEQRAAARGVPGTTWPPAVQALTHELVAVELAIACAADHCHAEDLARLRQQRRQLLVELERAKMLALAPA